MIRRIRKFVRGALVGLGVLAFTASPAGAHTTSPYGDWYVWQGQRAVYMTSGAGDGYATGETAWRPNPDSGHLGYKDFGFNFFYIGDYRNNGPDECVEAWMDFNRAGLGNHRNPTVFRHCNTNGNVWGVAHFGITDHVMRYFGTEFVGWDFVLCRSYRTSWDNKWHRTDCTNEQGAKSFAWVDGSSRDDTTDAQVANCGAGSTPLDSRGSQPWETCRIYLHVV